MIFVVFCFVSDVLSYADDIVFADIQTNASFAESLRQYRTTNDSAFGLHDFNYNNSLLTESLYNHLSATNYRGIVVSFDDHIENVTIVD